LKHCFFSLTKATSIWTFLNSARCGLQQQRISVPLSDSTGAVNLPEIFRRFRQTCYGRLECRR
jgi:hypothetical protein